MSVVKSRIGFCFAVAALLIALFIFSRSYLLYAAVILLVLLLVLGVHLRMDARRIRLELTIPSGSRLGRPAGAKLCAELTGRPLAAKYVLVELSIESAMFERVETRSLVLPLRGRKAEYDIPLEPSLCGEVWVSCAKAQICDVLELYRMKCRPFSEVHSVIYPSEYPVTAIPSQTASGVSRAEGLTQNRRGSDHTETFDIREYIPGDDVRTIHWKLSSKTDTLIVREPSDPSHFDLCVLPDLGLKIGDKDVSDDERNAAVALTISLGEQLLRQNIAFCLAIPTRTGLQLCQVRSQRELHRVIPRFLGYRVPEHAGVGLDCFLADRLEEYFTRIIILSDGPYGENLHGLDRRLGVTVVSAVGGVSPTYADSGEHCALVSLPAAPQPGERCRIPC